MKYEEIKVGDSYKVSKSTEKVIAKSDEHKAVMTIDEVGYSTAWNEDELEQFQPIKKELPESGLLVSVSNTIVYRTGERSGFGFNSFGRYENNDFWYFSCSPEYWRIATPEEEANFIKMLEAEAEKRGLGVDAKIKGHADGGEFAFNTNIYTSKFSLDFAFNKNGRIFNNGIWAEPMSAEPKTFMAKNCNNYWVETYSNLMAGDFMIRGDFSSRMDFAKKAPQEKHTEERIKQLEYRVEKLEKEFNSRDKEPEKKRAWWRS